MKSNQQKLGVFLCHASGDKPIVRSLYRKLLCEKNIEPWLDREKLLPGQNWDLEIRKAVSKADVILVCLSKQSINKEGYVQKEIKLALDVADEKPEGTIFLIPVKLEECDIPPRLTAWQWLNYFEDGAYETLLHSLEKRAEHLGIAYGQNIPDDKASRPALGSKSEVSVAHNDAELNTNERISFTSAQPKKQNLVIEQISGIIERYLYSDPDHFTYDEISSNIDLLNNIQDACSGEDELSILLGIINEINNNLYVARGHATSDVPRPFEYYQRMNAAKQLFRQIRKIRY